MSKILFSKLVVLIISTSAIIFPCLARASVYINEIAWMGISGTNGQYGEWVELYNSSDQEINLVGWKLYRNGGLIESDRIFTLTKSIQPKGYLVIERMTSSIPDPLPSINDEIGTFGGGNLANLPIGEYLVLKDNNESIIQSLDFSSGWPNGDNARKLTMQKISSGWITATSTPKTANAEQSSDQSSSSSLQGSSSSSSSSSSSNENIVSGSVSYVFKSEQISAKAGEDKTTIAGADIILEGKTYGIKGEPIPNARYFWTLGDGSYKEGQNIRHIYKYPGNYIAVLNASSGDISASDRLNVKVIPNELEIIETKNEFIKLKNKSGLILDLSGWFLRASGLVFKFHDYSLISANAELIISSDVSGLKFINDNFSAEILYPNGSLAFSYEKQKQAVLPKIVEFSNEATKPKEEKIAKQPENKNSSHLAVGVSKESISNQNSKIILNQNKTSTTSSQNLTMQNNLAGVIAISDKNKPNFTGWLILATFVGIIGGAGIFLARKFN